MNKLIKPLYSLIFLVLCFNAGPVNALEKGTVSHVVVVWLKQPGNLQMRRQFIEDSRSFGKLPGVISRHVGQVMPSDRVVVNDTFDVAVTVTLKDKKALKAYLDHPEHKRVLEEKLKPMVNRVVIYDFISE